MPPKSQKLSRHARAGRSRPSDTEDPHGPAENPPPDQPDQPPVTHTDECGPWQIDEVDKPLEPPCDCHKQPVAPPVHKCPPRAKDKGDHCCEILLNYLKGLPGGDRIKVHKPKQSVKVKTANLCCQWPTKDAVVPMLLLFLRRFLNNVPPANAFEQSVRKTLKNMKKERIGALKVALKAYDEMPDPVKECAFETRFDECDNPDLLDPAFLLKVWYQEGLRLWRGLFFGQPEGMSINGKVRPWERTFPADPDSTSGPAKITAPWPWICAVSPAADPQKWYKNMDYFYPGSLPIGGVPFEDHEFSWDCQTVPDLSKASKVDVKCDHQRPTAAPGYFVGDCNGDRRYNYPDSSGTICLTIPKVYPDQDVMLRGFNFFSPNCTVRLKSLEGKFPDQILGADVMGDPTTPETRNGKPVATCEVEDILTFHIPKDIKIGLNHVAPPPGRYSVEVVVPNDVGYAPTTGPAPSEFVSNVAWLDMQPDPSDVYRVWTDEAFCLEETDGLGSDEPWFRAGTCRFVMDGSQTAPTYQFTDIMNTDDVDSGEWISFSSVDLFRDKLKIGEVCAISVIGLEVDSESAARDQIKNFGDAYVEYMQQFYVGLTAAPSSGLLVDGLKVLATAGKFPLTGWIGGAALIVIAVAGIFYALWAPADPIGYDFMIFGAPQLHDFTDPASAVPPGTGTTISGIGVGVSPRNPKDIKPGGATAVYSEDHFYRSDDEDSTYRLVYRVERKT